MKARNYIAAALTAGVSLLSSCGIYQPGQIQPTTKISQPTPVQVVTQQPVCPQASYVKRTGDITIQLNQGLGGGLKLTTYDPIPRAIPAGCAKPVKITRGTNISMSKNSKFRLINIVGNTAITTEDYRPGVSESAEFNPVLTVSRATYFCTKNNQRQWGCTNRKEVNSSINDDISRLEEELAADKNDYAALNVRFLEGVAQMLTKKGVKHVTARSVGGKFFFDRVER